MKKSASIFVGIFVALLALATLGNIISALWPITTIAFVAIGTICTFSQKTTTIMSVAGLVSYVACWPVANFYGDLIGSAVCCAGVVLWFVSLIKSFAPLMTRVPTSN